MASRRVIEAKELLEDAQDWGMFSWMSQSNKDRVRSAIEGSTQVLDREVEKVKQSWCTAFQQAYNRRNGDLKLKRAMAKLHAAEDSLTQLTAQCKATFDEAERELNAGKARDGAMQARHAIEIHEAVLEMARSLANQPL